MKLIHAIIILKIETDFKSHNNKPTNRRVNMGTRGAIGFYKIVNGKCVHKVTYNHYDSYPSQLGNDVLDYINRRSIGDLNMAFDAIKMVKENSKPTSKAIAKCVNGGYFNGSVSERSTADWYCLLRNCQGDLEKYATVGYMIDSQKFLHDSLFCEWAYIINLTDNVLEVYKGFQKSQPKGRYSEVKPDKEYYAVELIHTFPLDKCPKKFNKGNCPAGFEE